MLDTPSSTAPCPTLTPVSNGMISYDPTLNEATYSCNTGYTLTSTSSSLSCDDNTMQWSSIERPTCERKIPQSNLSGNLSS